MKATTIPSSKLGVNCWAPHRALGMCHRCDRYDRCTYPERVPNVEYDQLRARSVQLRKEADEALEQARRL